MREIYSRAVDGIRGDEFVDIGIGPGRQGIWADGELGVVIEKSETVAPEALPAIPVMLEEGSR